MDKLVHNIKINVLEKDETHINLIYKSLEQILPLDYKKEKIFIRNNKGESFDHNVIHIISMKIHKKRHNILILQNIFKKLDKKDMELLYEQRKSRLDDCGNFFIRLDKKLLFKNIYKLTEIGDCFHFKIKIAAFPNKRENLMKSLEELLKILECSVL